MFPIFDHPLIGRRVHLIEMVDDPLPVPPHAEGTIRHVDSLGQLHVIWDNGRKVAVIPGHDRYEILPEE